MAWVKLKVKLLITNFDAKFKDKLTRIQAPERKSTRIQVLGSKFDLKYLIFYGLGKIESEATNTKLYG